MSYYQIGAEGLNVSAYAKRAQEVGRQSAGPYTVVAVAKNGTDAVDFQFPTRDEANAKYGELTENPKDAAYVAVFERYQAQGLPYDEAYFVATSQTTTTVRKQSALGWIVAGLAGIFGIAALKGKR